MLTPRASRNLRQLSVPLTALPPTFLLPIRAQIAAASTSSITTTTRSTDPKPPPNAYISRTPSPPENSPIPSSEPLASTINRRHENSAASRNPQLSKHTPSAKLPPPMSTVSSPSQGLLLRALVAQSPHYITIHLHAHPYMVTQGDTIRLPFHMRGVAPGTMIRFNRASTMGSRDITIRGGGSGLVDTLSLSDTPVSPSSAAPTKEVEGSGQGEPRRGEPWIDERLYVCRARVIGVESEPMRVIEKTKRRQRHVKKVKSKGRFTILKVVECRARLPEHDEQ